MSGEEASLHPRDREVHAMRHRARILVPLTAALSAVAAFSACNGLSPLETGDPPPDPGPPSSDDRVPLTRLGSGTYLGFEGGLYPGGSNEPPADHAAAGRQTLARIEPLDILGRPDPRGRIVLVSVGMSNTTQEFCSQGGGRPCDPWSFVGQAAADSAVDTTSLALVNGARGGQAADTWDSPAESNYDLVRDRWLTPLGLSEAQVQVAWVKQANPRPTVSLPDSDADAFQLERSLGAIVRAMKTRWPNLGIVFLSSRIYGGYAESMLNPEPYAYETAFSVKWLIEAQIEQTRTGRVDLRSGDVGLVGGAPWLAWGPYLWSDGANPRGDGLVWLRADFAGDGTHPAQSGEEKVGSMLLEFFKVSPYSQCWFLAGRSCQN
jgi:hypothetical protein